MMLTSWHLLEDLMSDKHDNPLRLDPPVRRSDPALGERLAQLARASTPTPARHRAWRAPLAGLAIVVGTGGLAYGTQAVVRHEHSPSVVVPGSDLSLDPAPSAAGSTDPGMASTPAAPTLPPPAAPAGSHDPGGVAGDRGRSADALASAPGQAVRSQGPGAVEHPSQSRSGQAHGEPSAPGDPSTAAPGRGQHSKGTKPTTAATPDRPSTAPSARPTARPTAPPTARPTARATAHATNRPTARPSLPPTAQGVG